MCPAAQKKREICIGYNRCTSKAGCIKRIWILRETKRSDRGSRLQNRKFQAAIDLVREGKVDLNHKVSHTFPLLEAQKAFDFNDSRDPSIRKIVLTMD